MAVRVGFEPTNPVSQVNALAVRCFQPLSHLTERFNFTNLNPANQLKKTLSCMNRAEVSFFILTTA